MPLPLTVLLETSGTVPAFAVVLLALAAVLVVFFIIVQLRRILRSHRSNRNW